MEQGKIKVDFTDLGKVLEKLVSDAKAHNEMVSKLCVYLKPSQVLIILDALSFYIDSSKSGFIGLDNNKKEAVEIIGLLNDIVDRSFQTTKT